MALALPDFPIFDLNPDIGDVSQRWKQWIKRLKNLFVALDVNDGDWTARPE